MRSLEMSSSPFEAIPKKPAKRKLEASAEPKFNIPRYDGRVDELKSDIRVSQGELEAMGLGPEVYTVDDEYEFTSRAIMSFIRQRGLKWVKKELLGDADDLAATYRSDDLGRAKVIHRWMRRDEKMLEQLSQDLLIYRNSPPEKVTWSTLKKAMDQLEEEGVTKDYLESQELDEKRAEGRASAREARTVGRLPPRGKSAEEMEASFGLSYKKSS